jgi:hypothetical protein
MRPEDLLSRIERLERQNRWRLGIALLAIFPLTLVCFMGAAAFQNEIRAGRFVLVDENGNVRGLFQVTKDGPSLSLLDENGKTRGQFLLTNNDSGIELRDEKVMPRMLLYCSKDGPGIFLNDKKGNIRGEFSLTKDGPSLELNDENGKPIWHSTPVNEDKPRDHARP